MKMIKMALLGGAAIAVTAASARADDMDALKAQIEALNARMAAMETAPAIPAGYQLIAISEGDIKQTPGLGLSAQELAGYGTRSTIISVLPTADAPAGTTITWSGYARAGIVFNNTQVDGKGKLYAQDNGEWEQVDYVTFVADDADENDVIVNFPIGADTDVDDWDVKARGQIRVTATTDTSVGEVGVDLRVRANFNGNGSGDAYMDVAWGYWAMTPELTLGGGYAGSLGNIGYGYDGACTCYYTDNAPVNFNPGDTTQVRLSYGSGPFSMAIALEDASIRGGGADLDASDALNGDQLGAAGEIKYAGDMFSAEIAGVWRGVDDEQYTLAGWTLGDNGIDSLWQIGAGIGFSLGDMASLSIGAALGEGPFINTFDGQITSGLPYNQQWWGVSGLASINFSDEFHAELAAAYKNRQGDEIDIDSDALFGDAWNSDGIDYDVWAIQGGLYYNPVDQLTIGLEAEYYVTSAEGDFFSEDALDNADGTKLSIERDTDNLTVDLVSVWRF